MKKLTTLLILWLLVTQSISAQNYSCISPEYKTWFTNVKGYLRGMRIDSVKTIGGNTVYYPYKSGRVRGRHLTPSAYQYVEDSAAGSWMGSEIIESPDGYTYIKNQHGDTIKIYRLAVPGESWVFFKDSSTRYVQAEIIATDTLSVNGNADSFKRIRLSVMEGNQILAADSLHGLELVLTQHHGFVQTLDFYLFPYTAYFSPGTERDYFFNLASTNLIGQDNLRESLIFNRVSFKPPTQFEADNFEVGDIHTRVRGSSISNPNSSYTLRTKTTILTKSFSNDVLSYDCAYISVSGYYGPPGGPPSQTDSGIRTYAVRDSVLWDTLRMPEEWQHKMIYYYFPEDTSYCVVSAKYTAHNSMIWEDGRLNNFEPSTHTFSVKNQLGLVSSNRYEFPDRSYDESLSSAGKPPSFCDEGNGTVGITDAAVSQVSPYNIFPNPGSNLVNIARYYDMPFAVQITDFFGRRMFQAEGQRGTCSIRVSGWPAGMYFISISAKDVRVVRKIVVHH